MDSPDTSTPEAELPADSLLFAFDVDTDTVSVADGMWQDQPDNVAAFVEARLGDLARGRGNLYICLDVSGEIEGRSDVERALIEVLRDTFATSRGSISFGLSEALRAANLYLFEQNRQVAREQRRMAGVSAVVLRGNDLYVAQAGPAVVYVEASERLYRYPAESDWFIEDSPLFPPEGTASAPLGIRREFASDLAHTSIGAGDVFVLATRALTQLATTEELAIAFTERSAQEIARHLEDLGDDVDMTALIAELMDPHASHEPEDAAEPEEPNQFIESLPVPLASLVTLDESEPPLEEDEEDETEADWQPGAVTASNDAEPELNWDDEPSDDTEAEEAQDQVEEKAQPQPVYAAAAALPMMRPPAYVPPPAYAPPPPPPANPNYAARNEPVVEPSAADWEAELEQRRAERAARRAAQRESVNRAVGGAAGGVLVVTGALGNAWSRAFGGLDWDGFGSRTNRFLNIGVSALITFILLLVRLVLPGAAPRSTAILPRRTTSEPVWLKALAIALPLIFIGLAFGRYMVEVGNQSTRLDALVAQADTIVKQAEINPDKIQAREQLSEAQGLVKEAQGLRDTQKARDVMYRIQDHLDEIDGVALLYFLPPIAELGGGQLKQIVASDQDVFLLDGRGQIYRYTVNEASGLAEPAGDEGKLLKTGDKVGDTTVDALELMTGATPTENKTVVVAVTQDALLSYDLESEQWTATKVTDSENWGDLRAIDSFGGNVYLLDAQNNQIYRYTPTATGYSTEGTPYFPQNHQPLLNKAKDMSIDGDVWVLNDNGIVQRYRAGVVVPFELGAVTPPLRNPVAIFTRPEVDALYIADAGNQRIVEFDKNGVFVRQFKPIASKGDVFEKLQDFTVNETKRKLYFVNSNSAYLANVPK